DAGVALGLAAFLGQETMAGIGIAQRLDDGRLGGVIDAGDVVVVSLDGGLDAFEAREAAHDDVTGTTRGLDGGIQVGMHGTASRAIGNGALEYQRRAQRPSPDSYRLPVHD